VPRGNDNYVSRPDEEARLAATLMERTGQHTVVLCGPGGMVPSAHGLDLTRARRARRYSR
jgi:hypothetical protein